MMFRLSQIHVNYPINCLYTIQSMNQPELEGPAVICGIEERSLRTQLIAQLPVEPGITVPCARVHSLPL
jgi:hypothetical protein